MIAYSVQGNVALLELRAPPSNSISFALLEELGQALQRAIHDPQVNGIVIHGGTERFSAGADLAVFQNIRSGDEAVHASRVFQQSFQAIEESPKPVLAAVAGHVLGGALELTMSCHARLAAERTRFSMPEVNLGINPGAGGTQRLPRLIGLESALDMLLSGRPVDAQTALRWGLIDAICPAQELIKTAVNLLHNGIGPLREGEPPCEPPPLTQADGSDGASPSQMQLTARRTGLRRDQLANLESNQAVFAKFEAQAAKVRPELIAPRKIIEAVRVGVEDSFQAGLLREQGVFRECMDNRATQNKIYIMFSRLELTKPPESKAAPIERAGVLGMGTMGTGIAQALLMAGLHVIVCDQNATALHTAAERIADSLQRRVSQGKMPAAKSQAALARLSTSPDPQALAGAQLVIEAVFEDIEVKRAAIARLEEICPPDTIVATNTSTINLDTLAAGMRHPDRLIGLHFFHPAQQMPLVEVIRRRTTPPRVVATALGLAKAMGKTPIVAENREGFVVNRLFVPYLTEAFWLLEEGARPEAIDRAMVEFGFSMGPLQLIDMSGIDILAKTQPILAQAFPYHGSLSKIVRDLMEQGHLGQKTGAGVYQYAPGDRTPRPHAALEQIIATVRSDRPAPPREPSGPDIVERLMLRMVAEAYRLLTDAVVQRQSDVDVAMVLGTGLADFRGGVLKYAADLGLENVHKTLQKLAEEHGPRYAAQNRLSS